MVKINKKTWIGFILIVLFGFFGFELTAIFDGKPETITLTKTILEIIPADIFFIVFGAFGTWVAWHFLKYYIKKN